ncbi:mannosyltransferase family protein [Streptomyces sp. NPDC059943]|uniref:mannosyltransferase family protein n=1 Tax=Streptomyces sp. NPDC059943 TaxID=3347010 RepID=UPI003662C443
MCEWHGRSVRPITRARRCPLSADTLDAADAVPPATRKAPARASGPAAPPAVTFTALVPRRVPSRRAARLASALRRAAPALGLFAAARLTGLLVLCLWAEHIGRSPSQLLTRTWDSVWYTRIAADGYGHTLHFTDGAVHSDMAFFPLYPGLVRAVTTVLPLDGGTAALLLSWAAAAAAAFAVYLLGERLQGRTTAAVLVLLWGLLPHSVVLSIAYTEPLLTAFAAFSLYAVLTGRWLWAGSLAALAGLSRPNGIAIAAAVCVAAAYELWKRRAHAPWRLWAGAVVAPLGWGGYVLWVGLRTGDPLSGYFAVQAGWRSRFDLGVDNMVNVRDVALRPTELASPMTALIVAAAVLLFALLLVDRENRPPLPLLVYSGVLLLIAVGGGGFFESKPRFLLPAFPLLLPLACALTKARPRAAIVVIAALAGLSCCYGTYLLTLAPMPL